MKNTSYTRRTYNRNVLMTMIEEIDIGNVWMHNPLNSKFISIVYSYHGIYRILLKSTLIRYTI